MNKKVEKILNILVIAIAIISIATNVFADGPLDVKPVETKNPEIISVAGQIMGILQTIGVVISVLVLVILGIKYMMASVEQKAEYKKSFIPYIVGAGLVFAGSIFANAIYQFFIGMNK